MEKLQSLRLDRRSERLPGSVVFGRRSKEDDVGEVELQQAAEPYFEQRSGPWGLEPRRTARMPLLEAPPAVRRAASSLYGSAHGGAAPDQLSVVRVVELKGGSCGRGWHLDGDYPGDLQVGGDAVHGVWGAPRDVLVRADLDHSRRGKALLCRRSVLALDAEAAAQCGWSMPKRARGPGSPTLVVSVFGPSPLNDEALVAGS